MEEKINDDCMAYNNNTCRHCGIPYCYYMPQNSAQGIVTHELYLVPQSEYFDCSNCGTTICEDKNHNRKLLNCGYCDECMIYCPNTDYLRDIPNHLFSLNEASDICGLCGVVCDHKDINGNDMIIQNSYGIKECQICNINRNSNN